MIDQRSPTPPTTGQRGSVPTALDTEILRLLSEGHTTDAVARRIGRSERTVRRRLRALGDEIGVDSTIEIVVHAVRSGWI